MIDAYKNELMKIKMDSINYSLAWMKQQSIEEEKKFQDLESRKSAYAREHNIITIENRLTDIPVKLNQVNSTLAEAERRLQEINDIKEQIELHKGNYSSIESIPYVANNTVLRAFRDQALALNRRIAELSKKYGPKHPRMVEAKNELKALSSERKREVDKLVKAVENEYELALETVEHRKSALKQTQQEALNLNERFNEYDRLSRELDTSRILHDSLLKRMKEHSARIQEKNVKVWVVEPATPPRGPFKPKKVLNLILALIVGTVGGVGSAFLLEYLDDTIKTPEDIENKFNTPVLGVVEKVADKGEDLYIGEGSFSTLSESYKIIRSSLMLSSPNNPPRVILVTSTAPGDGKTTTIINVAHSLAMLGAGEVLVIDCDLRKPRLHINLHIEQEEGLSSCLAGVESEVDKIIYSTVDWPFDIIPAGPIPPNPSELLSSERMRSLLSDLRNKYQFILLDSPPIFGAIDGLHLSPLADGTILVSRANKTTKDLYGKVLQRMYSVDSRILGAIINGAVIKKANLYHYTGYYSSYGEYGESGSVDEKNKKA
jgi:capsular exopolysaccharide synthesis family protein